MISQNNAVDDAEKKKKKEEKSITNEDSTKNTVEHTVCGSIGAAEREGELSGTVVGPKQFSGVILHVSGKVRWSKSLHIEIQRQ